MTKEEQLGIIGGYCNYNLLKWESIKDNRRYVMIVEPYVSVIRGPSLFKRIHVEHLYGETEDEAVTNAYTFLVKMVGRSVGLW